MRAAGHLGLEELVAPRVATVWAYDVGDVVFVVGLVLGRLAVAVLDVGLVGEDDGAGGGGVERAVEQAHRSVVALVEVDGVRDDVRAGR